MKFKVVNKVRFIISILIVTILFVVSFTIITNSYKAIASEEIEYIDIEVESGDTLWNIASKYRLVDQDVRELIFIISEVNNLKNSIIYPGQVLKIPKYK